MTSTLAGVCIAISICTLAALGWRDPMRLRMLATASRKAPESAGWTPKQRRLLVAAALLPGTALAASGQWAVFLIWTGGFLVSGWLLVQLLAVNRG